MKIHDFHQKLLYNVQTLEMLGKISECLALVQGVLNKLLGIKAELVQGKPNWQSWNFTELTSALRAWMEIYPRIGYLDYMSMTVRNQRWKYLVLINSFIE